MFQALLVVLLSAFSAQAVLLAQLDFFRDGTCSVNNKTSIPFFLGNSCMVTGTASSAKFNCSSNALDVYSVTSECTGDVTSLPFACTPSPLPFGIGFSCVDRPASNLVLLEVGTGCTGNTVTGVTQTVVQIINECMPMPTFAGAPTSYYMVTISGSSLTYKMFSDVDCATTPSVVQTVNIGGCQVQAGVGLGRLLQSGTVKYSLLGNAGHVSSALNALAAGVLVVTVAFVNLM